jgi:hypothetical protein
MVELVSIHIPKTAGSSFFRILKQVYGKASVTRLNTLNLTEDQIKEISLDPYNPNLTRVIHGHLKITQMEAIIKEFKPKVVTWLRDPVDRVISNYYFSMQRVREGKAMDRKSGTRGFSLLEYARVPENRNRASQLLDGGRLSDLFFIGIYEQYDKDLALLGDMLEWPAGMQIPHQKSGSAFLKDNDCATQFTDITTEMREEIAILNSLDVTLYNKAKSIRK